MSCDTHCAGRGKDPVPGLQGRPVTLSFDLRDAELYSFAFRKIPAVRSRRHFDGKNPWSTWLHGVWGVLKEMNKKDRTRNGLLRILNLSPYLSAGDVEPRKDPRSRRGTPQPLPPARHRPWEPGLFLPMGPFTREGNQPPTSSNTGPARSTAVALKSVPFLRGWPPTTGRPGMKVWVDGGAGSRPNTSLQGE